MGRHELKTNAARLLDRLGIAYELVPYPVDEEHLEASHVAAELGEPIEQVFKTLVLRGDKNGPLVCVVAGNREVDLKKAAKVSGNKKVEMVPLRELQPLTGYIRGGTTSLGMKKKFPTFVSSEALEFPFIYVSAGRRGLQIKIAPTDLMRAADARAADITHNPEEA